MFWNFQSNVLGFLWFSWKSWDQILILWSYIYDFVFQQKIEISFPILGFNRKGFHRKNWIFDPFLLSYHRVFFKSQNVKFSNVKNSSKQWHHSQTKPKIVTFEHKHFVRQIIWSFITQRLMTQHWIDNSELSQIFLFSFLKPIFFLISKICFCYSGFW